MSAFESAIAIIVASLMFKVFCLIFHTIKRLIFRNHAQKSLNLVEDALIHSEESARTEYARLHPLRHRLKIVYYIVLAIIVLLMLIYRTDGIFSGDSRSERYPVPRNNTASESIDSAIHRSGNPNQNYMRQEISRSEVSTSGFQQQSDGEKSQIAISAREKNHAEKVVSDFYAALPESRVQKSTMIHPKFSLQNSITSSVPQSEASKNVLRIERTTFDADTTIVNMEGYDIALPVPTMFATVETPIMDTVARYSGQGLFALVYDGLEATEEEFKEMCELMRGREAFDAMGVPAGSDLIEEYRTEKLQILSFDPDNSFSKRSYQMNIFLAPIMFNIGLVALNDTKMSDMDIVGLLLQWGKAIISHNETVTRAKNHGSKIIKVGETDILIPIPQNFKQSTTGQKDALLHFSLAPGETENPLEFGYTTRTIVVDSYLANRIFTEREFLDFIKTGKNSIPKSLPFTFQMENIPMTSLEFNASGGIALELRELPEYEKKGLFFYFGVFEANTKDALIEWKQDVHFCLAFIHIKSKILMIRIFEARDSVDFSEFSNSVILWRDAIIAANETR